MNLAAVVLAAGLGTRMKSPLPKVLHNLNGRPMLQYVLNALYKVKPAQIIVVAGRHIEDIKNSVEADTSIFFAVQRDAKGTGDALLKAVPFLKGFKGTVLVVNGDTPLITPEILKKFLSLHTKKRNAISFISFIASEPSSYGRVIRDEKGTVLSIIENRDATTFQKNIKEVNSGIYAIESHVMDLLRSIKLNKAKGEYYLTDLVHIAKNKDIRTDAFCLGSEDEFFGINTRQELEKAGQLMKARIVRQWSDMDIQFIDADSVYISSDTVLGRGTVVYPNVHLEGRTRIGKGCKIYPNVRIQSSVIEDGAVIKDSTVIEGSVVKGKATVGPFAHIRPGSEIGANARIGNFVELKKAVIGAGTKASHLTYLGDANVGRDVNIGAGTITCNYDGYKKYITTIEDNVFIGSDSQLIAPVKVGKGAYVGAGSTITKDIPSQSLALSRIEQKNIEGWAIKRQLKVESQKSKVKKGKR